MRVSPLAAAFATVLAAALAAPVTGRAAPPPPAGAAPGEPVAIAPVEVVAEGFREPRGVVVDPTGGAYVADGRAGTIVRVEAGGARVLAHGLADPAGLAVDRDGTLLIAEERRGRVLRLDPRGRLEVVAAGLDRPRWLAATPDGRLYVSAGAAGRASRGRPDHGRVPREPDPGEAGATRRDERQAGAGRWDEPGPGGDVVVRLGPGEERAVVAAGFHRVAGFALGRDALYVLAERAGRRQAVLVRVALEEDALEEDLAAVAAPRAAGLALDRLGAAFLAARGPAPTESGKGPGDLSGDRDEPDGPTGARHDPERRARATLLLKVVPGEGQAVVAAGVAPGGGLAFEPEGHLLVADAAGRLLRLRAPAPPTVDAPRATRRSPAPVTVGADPASLVAVYPAGELVVPLARAVLDGAARTADLTVPLLADSRNDLAVVAVGAGGAGLASAPTEVAVVHDARPPAVTWLEPAGEAARAGRLVLRAEARDGGSGVSAVHFGVDARRVATLADPAPSPDRPFAATAALDTTTLADGAHTLSVDVEDLAGNHAGLAQALLVDNTPPETEVSAGPAGEVREAGVTLAFRGTDALTPPDRLTFAWRLDAGPWSAFAGATEVTLTSLGAGPHRFEVKARDAAGNEDPTPAVRDFTVVPAPPVAGPPWPPADYLLQPPAVRHAGDDIHAAVLAVRRWAAARGLGADFRLPGCRSECVLNGVLLAGGWATAGVLCDWGCSAWGTWSNAVGADGYFEIRYGHRDRSTQGAVAATLAGWLEPFGATSMRVAWGASGDDEIILRFAP